jgi:hypothetical protein
VKSCVRRRKAYHIVSVEDMEKILAVATMRVSHYRKKATTSVRDQFF